MWRFIHATDFHLGSDEDGVWNNRVLCSMMPGVIECLRRDLAELKPDFILATGDIANGESRHAAFEAQRLLSRLGPLYHPAGGNHDFVSEESRKWFLDAHKIWLPQGNTYYSFLHNGLLFCVLDPWWLWADGTLCPFAQGPDPVNRWAVPPCQFEWLENKLREFHSFPAIIALHYPAIPIPLRMCREGMKDAGHLENGTLLMELLRRHPQVKAIFAGHSHMNYICHNGGLTHVITGALPEYPVEYRDVCVYTDRIEVHTRPLSDPSFAARSLIQGKDWTAGTEYDRTTIIRL